ncbi:hypothetical protein GCM10028774_64720 [Spirosoma jeollabukense]
MGGGSGYAIAIIAWAARARHCSDRARGIDLANAMIILIGKVEITTAIDRQANRGI